MIYRSYMIFQKNCLRVVGRIEEIFIEARTSPENERFKIKA